MNTTAPPLDGAAWEPQDFPWDRFEAHARVRGVPGDLAQLGRAVMREAYQHQWPADVARLYGWAAVDLEMIPVPGAPGVFTPRSTRWAVDLASCDQMIAHALSAPDQARADWQHQLATDGGRKEP